MKSLRPLSILTLLSVASLAAARADSDSDTTMSDHPTQEANLYAPDAGIESETPHKNQIRTESAAEAQQQKEKAQQEQNWLLRGYEEQKQSRSSNTSNDGTNLYYQISTNKDLAKLAGLTPIDPNNSGQALDINFANVGKNGQTLSRNPSVTASTPSQIPPVTTKPLSWSAGDFVSLHNTFAAPTNDSMKQFLPQADSSSASAPRQSSYVRQNGGVTALDTPGMTAAENDPVAGQGTLSLDFSPNESVSSAKAHEENLTALEPPQGSNLAQIQKLEASATKPPVGVKTAPPVPLNPVLFKMEYEDPPVTAPPSPPIRTAVDDPRDMTFH